MPTFQRLHLPGPSSAGDPRHPGAAPGCPPCRIAGARRAALALAAALLALAPLRLAAQETARLPVTARVLDPAPSRLALAAVREGVALDRRPTETALATIRVDSLAADTPARARRRVTIGFLRN